MATLGFAAVASASPAGGAQQATTSRPDVVSAAISEQPSVTNPTGTPTIKVCFDQQIANPVFGQFRATGADVEGAPGANPLTATSAAPIPSELSCASVGFAPGSNLAGFSSVEVLTGAVSPAGGGAGTNPQGAAALTGGDIVPGAGKIAGPNLTGASVADVAGGTAVTFTFDMLISPGGMLDTNFGYYNTAGAPVTTGVVGTVSDRAVKVTFPTPVAATARVFVKNDAVTLAGQPGRGNAATATSGAGGLPPASSAPDIAKITRVAGLQATYDISYSQNITATDASAANCQADTPAGRYPGTAGAVQNATTVRVTFGTLAASSRADEEVVRISDNGGCVTSNAGALASTVGAAPVQNKDHTPGFTSGPDLSGCSAPAGGTDVTYTFDELIAPGAVPGAAFGLVDANGDRSNGTGAVLQVVDNKVTVRYAVIGMLTSAMGCTVDRGAVTDRAPGVPEPNPVNTVKANSAGTPENTKAAPPATVPGPAVPPVRPPFVKRAVRSVSATPSCRSVGGGKVRCTTKGTVKLSTDLTPLGKKNICIGTVRVRYTSGKRTIATRTARLSTSCTYRKTTTFKLSRKLRAGLRVTSKYNGSLVSKTKSSRKTKARVR